MEQGHMIDNLVHNAVVRSCLILSVLVVGLSSGPKAKGLSLVDDNPRAQVIGTWAGDSVCVGNHPTCNTEKVVYRIEAVEEKPNGVLLLADKIIDQKRVPMYSIELQYDAHTRVLAGEFTSRTTHGLWRYEVSSNEMKGTLITLPDKELWREIKVRRVPAESMPPAPARDRYGD
jgi:hypothetical protein